jgi:hypothetical protein
MCQGQETFLLGGGMTCQWASRKNKSDEIKEMSSGACKGKYFVIRQRVNWRLQKNRNRPVDHVGESEAARAPLSRPSMRSSLKNVAAGHSKTVAASKAFAMGQLNRRVDKGDHGRCVGLRVQYLKTGRAELRRVKAKLFTQRALAMCLEENLKRRCCVVHIFRKLKT